ncbi:MAG: serine/threonine protein kinase, partial [Sinomonas sp.]|nr:serine/threonine protein kinase [Sinomonas sp.]
AVLGRTVAVKTFRTHTPDPRHEQRRRGEMEVLARLSHPSLVHLFDAGAETSADGTTIVTYLVMEFVDGTDLRRQLASGPLAHDDARLLGIDLAGALAYLHDLGIVHRDIKPANILVPAPGDRERRPAKLTDFGIARLADAARLTATNTTIGTANYLSPEQARGEAVGPASDVYSLGLVLLECLTGAVEFPGGAVESAVARLQRDPRVPARLGEPWTGLLPRMLARDAVGRPSAREVEAILRLERALGRPAGNVTEVMPSRTDDGATRPLRTAEPSVVAPTRVFPTEQGPERPSVTPPPRPNRPPARSGDAARPRRRPLYRRPIAWAAAAVVLLALTVLVPLALRSAAPPPRPAPASPAVPGPLGTHLDRLDRSVRP